MTRKIPKPETGSLSSKKKATLLPESAKLNIEQWNEGKISFSFRFFDRNHKAFNCGDMPEGWYISFMDHLKHISEYSRSELFQQRTHFRLHAHDWSKTEFKYNLPESYLEQLSEDSSLQFSLGTGSGRVHGFMIENTFFVVWLDPHHNLYPSDRHGGVHWTDHGYSAYEILQFEHDTLNEKINQLQIENGELMKMLSELTEPIKKTGS